MRVADSSYITEGLLKRKGLLEEDFLLTVDLAVYETANSIWKHQCLLKDLKNGAPYVSILHELIESGRIRVIRPGKELMEKAYSLAAKYRRPIYDTIFVALALELGSELATFDRRQTELLRSEAGN
ncbi:MAG: type II toxin-antitoxin system VapC family toxin [Nitrososphaerales archaeon]|nr:type II toxin-antitoxin system VapC family toxin [Nitrososphaerales archaeon]